MKNSFIKNYEAFEGKACIGYVYALAENWQGRYLHEVDK